MSKANGYRIGVAVALLAWAVGARANLGEGVQLGEKGKVRPYLDVEERYDSAVLFSSAGIPKADFVTHIRPGLTLQLPTKFAELAASANLDWAQYTSESDLSRLYGGASVKAGVNRGGTVGLEVSNDFRRSDRSSTLSLGYATISTFNDLQVWAPWRPGGGALSFALGGEWITEHFEPFLTANVCSVGVNSALCDTSNASKLSYDELRGNGQIRWRFLPRTAAMLDVSYVTRLPSDRTLSTAVDRVEVRTGVSGLVSPHVAATVRGGYGDTIGTAGKSFGTPLADFELEYLPMPALGARVGYTHSLGTDPGTIFGLYRSHKLFVESRAVVAGIYTLRLTGSYDRLEYDGIEWNAGLGVVEPRLDADLKPWLRVGAGYAFSYRCQAGVRNCLDKMFTSGANSARNPTDFPGYLNYKKHEVFLRADVIY